MTTKYLGQPGGQPVDDLDVFPAPAGCGRVVMTSDEVTAICPVTGQPDHYTVTIDYAPERLCIESKSLKLYLWHFRDVGVFCEQLSVDIRDKVLDAIDPREVAVTVKQKARGGITIEAYSTHP
jgi:7-cyano-7-deazaguanine reductase